MDQVEVGNLGTLPFESLVLKVAVIESSMELQSELDVDADTFLQFDEMVGHRQNHPQDKPLKRLVTRGPTSWLSNISVHFEGYKINGERDKIASTYIRTLTTLRQSSETADSHLISKVKTNYVSIWYLDCFCFLIYW